MHQIGQVNVQLSYIIMSGKSIIFIFICYIKELTQYYSNSIALLKDSDSDFDDIIVDYSALEDNAGLNI